MMFRTIFSTLLVVFLVFREDGAETTAGYSSFDLVIPKNKTDVDIFNDDVRNVTYGSVSPNEKKDLVSLLDVYDTSGIRRFWDRESAYLSHDCRRDMYTFLTALDNSDLWALKETEVRLEDDVEEVDGRIWLQPVQSKMETRKLKGEYIKRAAIPRENGTKSHDEDLLDASGRYTTGFFWGNSYWTGSETLCKNIGLKRRHYTPNGNLPNEKVDFISEDPAPIDLGFYKIKALLKLPKNVAPMRTILLGLCAPYSCNEVDISTILNMSLSNNNEDENKVVDILNVRTPHNAYYFWEDATFWVLAGVTGTVLTLLVVGTSYDYCRDRRYAKVNQSRIPFTNNYLGNQNGKVNDSNKLRNGIGNSMDQSVSKLDDNSNPLDNIEESSVHSDSDLEIWQNVLLSFSIRENMKTICDNGVSVDTIPTIHGLRAISMAWVILGHTCIVIFKYSDNMEFRTIIEKEFFFQTIMNGAFSVDTFFFISGLLVSFLYFRTTAKIDVTRITGTAGIRSHILQFLGLIAYRYGRLTAPYMFVLGCVQVTMKSFYHNSVFDPPTLDHENCPKYWWRNALYINTLFPVQEMCMLWSWYLADDSQFYILGIILLIAAVSHLKAAAAMAFAFLFSSWATTAYVAYVNNHLPSQDDPLALFDKIYDKPWTRLGPYLIGMIVGWILFKTECKIEMKKVTVLFGWLLTMTGMSSLVYGLYEMELDLITSAAYSSLSHSAWALGLAWIVIACSTGHGGFINKLLSASVLYPFSRVTYCAYLIHPLVIRMMIINLDSPLHLNKEVVMFLFFGQVVASYILSFTISIAFEAPVVSLLRLFSPTKTSRNIR